MVESRLRSSTARTSSLADADSVVRIGLAAFGRDVAAGIVDENIDRPQFFRHGLDHPRDVGAISEIAERADGADAMRRRHRFRDRRQCRSLAIFHRAMLAHAVNGDIGTQACKPFGKGSARPRPAPVTSATLPCSVRAASYVGMMSSPDVKG